MKPVMAAQTSPRLFALLFILILAACSPAAPLPTRAVVTPTLAATIPSSTATAMPATPAPDPTPVPERTLHIADAALPLFDGGLNLPPELKMAAPGQPSDLLFAPVSADSSALATWVYALVAPFPTITDGVTSSELRAAWRGRPPAAFAGQPLRMTLATRAALVSVLGEPAAGAVQEMMPEALRYPSWDKLPSWAIVPFDTLEPRWKVLAIDGISPLHKDANLERYPLVVRFGLQGPEAKNMPTGWVPTTNRDPDKMTVLVLTGVTALARGTAERMDAEGITYPAQKIGSWLRDADLTHVSNEVSFYADCPAPERRDPRFCSRPTYIGLLRDAGADVIELTGNHLLDWGPQPFLDTLRAYQQEGWGVYGGGIDLAAARAPLLVEDHGNRIAFLGCNPAGPGTDWATKDTPGTAPCDYPAMAAEIKRLRGQGYLVVVTFQHIEVCTLEPHLAQKADFQKAALAGAAIVSGSQAHCPQAMSFADGAFTHYGLGNLFFDQTDMFASRVMIDRHVIYNGVHVSTELLTAQLEDRAQPRPMTAKERARLLEDVFRASGWIR